MFRQRRVRSGNDLNRDNFAKDMIKEQHPGRCHAEMIAFVAHHPERFKLGHAVVLDEAITRDSAPRCNAAKVNAFVKP